jgi:hypothetical protein
MSARGRRSVREVRRSWNGSGIGQSEEERRG